MNPNGRTMAQAIAEGTAFELRFRGGGRYWPPACETPEEVMDCAAGLPEFAGHVGEPVDVIRITGGEIGCRHIEHVMTAVLREKGANGNPCNCG